MQETPIQTKPKTGPKSNKLNIFDSMDLEFPLEKEQAFSNSEYLKRYGIAFSTENVIMKKVVKWAYENITAKCSEGGNSPSLTLYHLRI